jgi:hypothetical protein
MAQKVHAPQLRRCQRSTLQRASMGRDDERRAPILCLKIHDTASFNRCFVTAACPWRGRNEDRRGPIRVLGVYQGLRACRRQQCRNRVCISIARSSMQVYPPFMRRPCILLRFLFSPLFLRKLSRLEKPRRAYRRRVVP